MPTPKALIFGSYRLIPSQRLLLQGEAQVPIGSRALDVLIALVEHPGLLVSKERLLASVWPKTNVHEANLRVHIGGIRKLLGDGQPGVRYIVSEAGRGYRFVAPVVESDEATPAEFVLSPDDGAPAPTESMRSNLTPTIGRSKIIDALAEQLPKRRFITIVGPGGIGKTTVALAVAERLGRSENACFVDLGPVTDRTLVGSKLTSSLGLVSRSENQIQDLIAFLQDKAMLIVVDTCEHMIDAVTPLIEALLDGAPGIQILTTSREPLRGKGEWVQRLAPLASPESATKLSVAEALAFPAIQLFVERAVASLDGFEMSESDVPIVTGICRKLDGLPLAIELAASRIDAFGLRGLAALLEQRFQLPTLGHRMAPPRHRTLTATLDWSYETLPDPERAILRRLAIFAGPFTLDSASVVAADHEMDASRVVDCAANLVEKSLVAADLSGANVQYRLLDATRAYSLQKLREQNEFEPLARRHAQFYRNLLERTRSEREKKPVEWLVAYRHEIDNVRSALDWAFSQHGDPTLAIELTLAAIPLWTHLSLNEECCSRVEAALRALGPDAAAQARTQMQLFAALAGASIFTGGALPEINAAWSNVIAIAERIGDADFQLRGLRGLWAESLGRGDFRSALVVSQRFTSMAASAAVVEADALVGERLIGFTLHLLGEQEKARLHIEHVLARYLTQPSHITRYLFDQRLLARGHLAIILWLQGFPDQAMRTVEAYLNDDKDGGHAISVNYVLVQSACPIALYNGDLLSAERYLRRLLDRSVQHGAVTWDKWARCHEGVLLIKKGDLFAGTNRLKSALDDLPPNTFHMRYIAFLCELAEGLNGDGQIERARTAIETALALSQRDEELWCMPELLRVRGEIALKAGAPSDAEGYFHQSLDWARRQKVLSLELRGATSLARLWQGQGRSGDAYGLLAPIYNRFTEGFQTSDLRMAKSLLDELA